MLKINNDTTSQLVLLMKNQPGLLPVANDGVTVNHKSKILFTATIGSVSMFVIWLDLGSDVHVTDEEVTAGYKVCMDVKKQFGNLGISCIPVENATAGVAARIAKSLMLEGDNPFALRDPVHCIDLGAKDLANTPVVKTVLDEAILGNKFARKNRVQNIRNEMVESGEIRGSVAPKMLPDTRMNLTNDCLTTKPFKTLSSLFRRKRGTMSTS